MTVPNAPRLLIVETSGRSGQVALSEGRAVVARRRMDESRRQARDLAPFVRDLLAERGWKAGDLTAVVVSLGPGSYTGLRVGLISAKVLCYALGCTLIGVPTFAALAEAIAVAELGRPIEVLADAQKDRVYAQSYGLSPSASEAHFGARSVSEDLPFRTRSVSEDLPFRTRSVSEDLPLNEASLTLRARTELRILPWDDWARSCPAGAIVTGPGAMKFPDRLPAGVTVASPELREVQPECLLRLALERLDRGEHDDPFTLEPLYLRPSSAEEQWDARK